MNGKRVRVGSWLLYPYWDSNSGRYRGRCVGQITSFFTGGAGLSYAEIRDSANLSFLENSERLPYQKKKRDEILFLKKLES